MAPSVRLVSSLAVVAIWLSTSIPQLRANDAPIDLTPNINPGDTVRVSIEFEAGGHDLVRPQDAEKGTVGEIRKLPMSVSAKLSYDERRLASSAEVAPGESHPLAIRYYNSADVTIKVDKGGVKPILADDRRLILVEQTADRPILSCPAGPLSREELDLIDVVGNSTAIDRLLPTEPVAVGDSWKHQAPVMAALLALDSVAVCEVQSILDEFNSKFAKIRLAGIVHGTVDGAATEHEIRAVYLFDRTRRRVARMNLAVREKRSIGDATAGLEGVAKVQMKIEPADDSSKLADEGASLLQQAKQPLTHNLIQRSAPLGFQVEHDRKWFVISQGRESVVMRRVDPSGLIAQCTLTTLPAKSEGRQTTLEQFQKDVTFALGKNFGELVTARQWQNKLGHYCFEIVARGTVQQVPVEWHYFLVAQDSGHRVSLAVTIEGSMVDRLDAADRALVETLELIPITRETAETAAKPADQTTR